MKFQNMYIRQKGSVCSLYLGDELIKRGGRVEIKELARKMHFETGNPVFNFKRNGTSAQVIYN